MATGFHRSARPIATAVARALSATATEQFAGRAVTSLSGGERARVALARALATEAAILLADEPTMSLDPRHQLTVMDLFRRAARAGSTVLVVLHDLTLAARFADRVLVMADGRLVADGNPRTVLSPSLIADVFGVEAVIVDAGVRTGAPALAANLTHGTEKAPAF